MAVMKYKVYPYHAWETYLEGMYSDLDNKETQLKYDNVFSMFTNQDMFYKIGLEMMAFYRKSCLTFLRNKSINRKAFIGQAAACYGYRCPERVTKQVWSDLDEMSRILSNETAIRLIKIYEERCSKVYR